MRSRAARLPILAGAAVLALAVGGCAQPEYQYVANDDRDLVLRLPQTWSRLDTDEVLKAAGVDPTTLTGWRTYYDAAPRPSVAHVVGETPDPVLYVRSQDIDEAKKATITADFLRNSILPVTASERKPSDLERAQAGLPPEEFTMIANELVSTATAQGVHVVFSVQTGAKVEYYDQLAVTDPKKTRMHLVMIHCGQACWKAQAQQIDDVVTSLTLKPKT